MWWEFPSSTWQLAEIVGPEKPATALMAHQSLRLQPVIECINPVVAAGALLPHAEAMAAAAENVDLRFVAR